MVCGDRHEKHATGLDGILKIYNNNMSFQEISWYCENNWLLLESWRHVTGTATSNKSIIKI